MILKPGRQLAIGATTLLTIAFVSAQTAAAQTANKHQVKRHVHHQHHHSRPDLDLRLDAGGRHVP